MNEEIIRVTKLEYLPALTYECIMCEIKKVLLHNSKYVQRKIYQGDYSSLQPEDLYQPVNIKPIYCPSCHQRMTYDPKGDFPVTFIFGRNQKGQRRKLLINDIEPEFYVKKSNLQKIKSFPAIKRFRIKRVEQCDSHSADYRLTPYAKIVVYLPSDVHNRNGKPPSIRDEFGFTSQADILFEMKAFAELRIAQYIKVQIKDGIYSKNDITPVKFPPQHTKLHYFAYDIETKFLADEDIIVTTQGKVPIYSLTGYSNYANAFFVHYHHKTILMEKSEMLNAITSKVSEYVYGKYCPQCKTPNDDGQECPECEINLTSLDIINPVFSNFLLNTQMHIISAYTESDFLAQFLDVAKKGNWDIMGGWNSKFFDDPALMKRTQKLVRNPVIPLGMDTLFGVLPFDFMDVYAGTKRTKNLDKGLNAVAGNEIHAYKFEYADDINELYNHDLVTLLAYNLIDTALVVGINEKMKPL